MRPVPTQLAAKIYRAADLLADQGLDDTKIEEIAEVTGVPKATLYYYFAGKQDVLVFLFQDFLSLVAGDVAVAADAPVSGAAGLRAVIEAQLRLMFQHPAVCRALIGDLGRAARLPEIATAINGAFYDPLERLLAAGAADGSLRPVEDTIGAAATIFGAVTLAGLGYLVTSPHTDPDQAITTVQTILLEGLTGDHDRVNP
ncbi:MAG TPA: TetR/AcrR family transcriptional regulator [Mycobacteriales bacterium]|jgi:AcrR family transcriptional regulator|nr:TetR/AcrR family transcriptional regulator [Mycobacteriales bacterium]HWC36395.1 TetR/AcrR family transcriptional regulator [Mycobacteriales bacterium]